MKYEYGLRHTLPNLQVAKQLVKQVVGIYNTKRIHWSLDMKTPEEVHQQYNKVKYKSYAKKEGGYVRNVENFFGLLKGLKKFSTFRLLNQKFYPKFESLTTKKSQSIAGQDN